MTAKSMLRPDFKGDAISSNLRAAFRWWFETMGSIWPFYSMAQVNTVSTKTIFVAGTDGGDKELRGEDTSFVLPLMLEDMSEAQIADLRGALSQTRAAVRLAPEQTYMFETTLPKAALGHGSHAIEYALRTESPIPVDQIYHDTHHSLDGDTASVTVILVRRSTVEDIIAFFEAHTLPLERINALHQDDDGATMEFSFFQRASISQGLLSRNVGIGLCAGLFLIPLAAGIAIWLIAQLQASSLQSNIEAQQATYGSEIAIARAFDDIERATALLNAADTKAQPFAVLGNLAATVPQTAWIDRLMIDGDSLDLQGMSFDPNGVAAALRDTSILSSVRLDRVTAAGDERQPPLFTVSALLKDLRDAE